MIVFFILLLLFLLYIYATWNDRFWEKLGVPFEKPIFFFGTFKELLIRNRHDGVIAADMYKKFDGVPYVGYFNLRVPCLLIRDPDLVQDIIVKDYNAFQGTGFEIASTFFTNVIVSSVFGIEIDAFENPDNPFTKMSRSMFVSSYMNGLFITIFIRFPWLNKLFKFSFVDKQKEKDLIVMSCEILKCQKDGAFFKAEGRKNNHTTSEDTPSDYEYEVAGRVFGFLLEGTETSSGLFSFALYELAYNPYIQGKLRAELDKAAVRNGGKISFDDIMHLPYLDMILSETLRLYPPGFSLQRISNNEYTLPPPRPGSKPVKIPPGTPVQIPIYGIQMDPKYFPDPERFDPDRFTDEVKNSRHKFSYLPFGEGPRICLGGRLAMVQTKAGIAGIIRNFEVRVSLRTLPKPLKIDPNFLLLAPVGNLWLTFHERCH